jgi:hypothetical protein
MGRNRSNATAAAVKGNLVAGTGVDTSGLLAVGANNTVLTADSTTATGLKWAAAAGQKVIQIVNATYNTEKAINTITNTATDLTATITPTLSTSKILVMITQYIVFVPGSDNQGVRWFLYKNGANILQLTNGLSAGVGRESLYGAFNYLDSPATTSATTYATFGRVVATTGTAYFNADNTVSTITLIEIGA